MAPSYGRAYWSTTHSNVPGGTLLGISSANSTQLGLHSHHSSEKREGNRERDHDRNRARQTRRKRDIRASRNQMVLPTSRSKQAALSSCSQLTHCTTHGQDDNDQGKMSSRHDASSSPEHQRGCALQDRSACEDGLGTDGGLAQRNLPHDSQKDHSHTKKDSRRRKGMDVDDFADIFCPASSPRLPREPVSIKPVQYDSPHHLPLNRLLHPSRPVLPATRREPIRMLNKCASPGPGIEAPAPSSVEGSPPKSTVKAIDAKMHPVNTYKGSDPIKRCVQNKRLQLVLSGRPMPKPRLKPDRMVLKCAGRREFR